MSTLNYNEQCPDPLSTPEICKMILSDTDIYATVPIRESQNQYIDGLMADFEDLASNTVVSTRDVFGYGPESSAETLQTLAQGQGLGQTGHYPQYQPYNDNGYSSSSSFPASPELNYDNAANNTATLNSFNNSFSVASPAESHFSSDSAVSFYNMDQPIQQAIKQEIQDFPAVIEEINQSNSCQTTMVGQQQQQQQPIQYQQYSIVPQQQYQMVDTTYNTYQQQQQQQQQPEFLPQVPTTVTNMQQVPNIVYQQHLAHQPQGNMTILTTVPQVVGQQSPQQHSQQHSQQQQVAQTVAGRKRSPNGAFASTSESSTSSAASTVPQGPSGSKKTRLTKRQKQQLMDKQVDEYTQKNKDLRNQIELLERKVQFCTQFLQKYVSPIVQGRSNTWTPDIVNAVSVEAM